MSTLVNTSWINSIKNNGIVGSGGAGFPAYAKLKSEVEYVLLNGAECEPLLHKDKELMKRFPNEIVEGLKNLREFLSASEAILGIKDKYHDVIDLFDARCDDRMHVHHLPDAYPAGDEFVLVYEATERVVPPGGLPLHVGCLVMNVETIINIVLDKPVTTKFLTVAGAVHDPKTVEVPIGVSIRDVVDACGGAYVEPYAVLTGGAMMGKLPASLDEPITKTTGGILVFPIDHPLIQKYQRSETSIRVIGKSACDQCTFCTELCPRYLLGHPIEPHKAMRALGFSHEKLNLIGGTLFCCECNICSLIACPEDLDPKNVCVMNKKELRSQSYRYPEDAPKRDVHGMRHGRQTPISRLIQKLGLSEFTNKGPLTKIEIKPESVKILLQQHIGAPAQAIVTTGDRVSVGDMIGQVNEDKLGCPVHASVDGIITEVTENHITITT